MYYTKDEVMRIAGKDEVMRIAGACTQFAIAVSTVLAVLWMLSMGAHAGERPSFPAAWQGSWCLAKTANVTRTSADGFSVVLPSYRYQRGPCEPNKMALIEGDRYSQPDISCRILSGAYKVRCDSDDEVGDYDEHITMSLSKDTLTVEFDGEITRTEQ